MKAKVYIIALVFTCLNSFGQTTNYYLKGVEYYTKADYSNAQKQFEKSLGQNLEATYNIYVYLGLTKYAQKKYDAAYNDFHTAVGELNKLGYSKIEDMPSNIVQSYAMAVYDRGLAQYNRGNYQDAINDFNYALIYKYTPSDCYYQIANSYYNLSDFAKSIDK